MDGDRSEASIEDVLVLDRSAGDQVQHLVDPAGVDKERIGELGQDADIGLAGRPEVTDQGRPLALEHCHQTGVGTLHRLLEHDVGLVESGRRAVVGVVADLGG